MKTLRASKKFRIYKSTLRELGSRFPAAFPRAGRRPPLKIGIFDDIRDDPEVAASLSACRLFLRIWTSSTAYLKAVEAGRPRVDLAGRPAGGVNERHAAEAKTSLDERKRRRPVDRAGMKELRSTSTKSEAVNDNPSRVLQYSLRPRKDVEAQAVRPGRADRGR
jgi:ProP effector